jgi:hypothetical protein
MTDDSKRMDHLVRLRDELLDEMAEADLEFSRVRMALERQESEVRIGRPTPDGYTQLKGRDFPRAEARVLDLFRQLLKLEDKIKATAPRPE